MRSAVLVWVRLARVYQRWLRAATDDLRRWNLTGAQFDVLAQLGPAEGCTQQELAAALLTTKGNACQLLDRMEAAGLVRRVASGRCNRLYLTASGRSLRERAVPAHEAWIAARTAVLGPEEQRVLLGLLRRLERGVGPTGGPGASAEAGDAGDTGRVGAEAAAPAAESERPGT